ncbi:MAG: FtsX-like permease family protein, partial [Actinomycetia bacterium]|nr:FtsX-like permease family protein [Actinomycetes bacterium]
AKAETDAQQGFLYLLQAYLGLGLLIGIAGLGVVLARAVRERRRQFGVMRALGIAAPVIRRAFVVEASFVAVQGVVLGIGLGLLSSWQVLTRSSAFEDGLGFTVPAQILIGLALACLAASLLMTSVPAIRAGRTTPAVALRMTT